MDANTTAFAVAMLLVGIVIVLRSVAVITTRGRGRFPFDPAVSLVGGVALLLAGQALLR